MRPAALAAVDSRLDEVLADRVPPLHQAFTGAAARLSNGSLAFAPLPRAPWLLDWDHRHARCLGRRSFIDQLQHERDFRNPEAWGGLVEAFCLDQFASWRVDVRKGRRRRRRAESAELEGDWFYDTLRDEQNRHWADERLERGVTHAKAGRLDEALKCIEQALGMCPKHADALVARGALQANRGELHSAAADLQRAISIDPAAANAQSYLDSVRQKLRSQPSRSADCTPSNTTAATAAAASAAADPRSDRGAHQPLHRSKSTAEARSPLSREPASSGKHPAGSRTVLDGGRADGELYQHELLSLIHGDGGGGSRKHSDKKRKREDRERDKKKKKKKRRKESKKAKRKSEHRDVSESASSEDGGGDGALHPILSRSKHALWG